MSIDGKSPSADFAEVGPLALPGRNSYAMKSLVPEKKVIEV